MSEKNHLEGEKSPYLREHAENPVDWYPWSDEAFEKAKREDKPIFLSIGYSSCHWCHVMKDESFEDEEIAEMMNDAFVSIKVDKEERPDIDSVYMDVAKKMTGRGGWPLNILMTPDKRPFHAFTYLPKEGGRGMPGLKELLSKMKRLWEKERRELLERGERIIDSLKERGKRTALDENVIDNAFQRLSNSFDDDHGGFGDAPKFPSPHNLLFLLRYWRREDDEWALRMVKRTLKAMRRGGIYDHLGYGFHRYSTDARWKVPHFEKMLYDQAMLIRAYTESYQITGDDLYSSTVDETVQYLERNLMHEQGAFFSSEDADIEGKEGEYYLWEKEEIEEALGEDRDLFIDTYNVEEDGNYREESSGEKTGRNVLFRKKSMEKLSRKSDLSEERFIEKIREQKERLFDRRRERERPREDEKILTDWNGMLVGALSKVGFVLDEERYIQMAERAIEFIWSNMIHSDHRLYHSYIDGETSVEGLLDDYAFVIHGLLELYQATFDIEYLERAEVLMDTMIEEFYDEENGGFFQTPADKKELPVRNKQTYDGASPSGNSFAFLDLMTFYELTGAERYRRRIEGSIEAISSSISSRPTQHTMFLAALDTYWRGGQEIIFVGEKEDEDLEDMLDAVRTSYGPGRVIALKDEGSGEKLEEIAEFTEEMEKKGKTTAYICEDFTCREPVTDVEEFKSSIQGEDQGPAYVDGDKDG